MPGGRPWTSEEEDFLRENFKKISIAKLVAKLGRTEKAIKQMATAKKLTTPCHRWTLEEDSQLKNLYGKLPPQQIAEKLNKTIDAVYHRAERLKITRETRRWTEQEINYLEDNWGRFSLKSLCKNLKRSEWGVVNMAQRVLGLGPASTNQGLLTATCLSKTIGVSSCTVLNWIRRHNLKAKYVVIKRTRKIYQININDFWKWAEHNQHRFDSRKIEQDVLGKEPAWMKEKRRLDYQGNLEG